MWSHLKDPYIVNCMELNLSTSERREGFVAPVPTSLRNAVNICLHIHAAPIPFLKNNKNNKVYDHQIDTDKNLLTFHHYHSSRIKVQTFVGLPHLPW